MVRKAEARDISRIAEIVIFAKRSAYRSIFQNDKVSFGEMQVVPLALSLMDTPELLDGILVFDDEFVKGMANIKRDGIDELHIKELFVDPFFQNRGIGGKILMEIENYGARNGVNFMYLWVLEKNKPAQYFYEKYKFTPTGEKEKVEGTVEYILKYGKRI